MICLSRTWSRSLVRRRVLSGSRFIPTTPFRCFSRASDSDALLRDVFDQNITLRKSTIDSKGLFLNPYLKTPEGLVQFCGDSLKKAQTLVAHLTADSSPNTLKHYIRNLDRISDILCRVIDLAEFIRLCHPDEQFVNAAQICYSHMFEYMNILNTDVELYKNLERVLSDKQYSSTFSEEELAVGNLLLRDFNRSGIGLDQTKRQAFVDISTNISLIGQDFHNGLKEPNNKYLTLSSKDLKGVESSFLRSLARYTLNSKRVETRGPLATLIVRNAIDPEVRRKMWLELHDVSNQQIKTLESLLKERSKLASLMSCKSYSAYQLEDKMAKTPENVIQFLRRLVETTFPSAVEEVVSLAKLNPEVSSNSSLTKLELAKTMKPWDRDYYASKDLVSKRSKNVEHLSSYFSLGTVVQGLSRLFNKIYGISFEPVEFSYGETWHPDVVKLNVVSENEGLIGIIYCDLFERSGKTNNPAHFTICCSRKIYQDEFNDPEIMNTIQTTTTKEGESYQLPVITLVCSFGKDSYSGKSFLTLSDVETIFHEMGHAMHSMLGRTNLHNVSGTRCATDFVELPSVLMEHFANSFKVLSLFARHHVTNEPLSESMLLNYKNEMACLKHSETFSQIKMALLDQVLHSEQAGRLNFDSISIYHDLESKYEGVFSDPYSRWIGQFGHLFGYGASYYSYLLDRAIAAKIWAHLFESDPLSREAGEKFRQTVLKWGGSKDPWKILSEALDDPRLESGDKEAMKIIGEVNGL